MDIGDRVKVIKGNPLGKIGVIMFLNPVVEPVNLDTNPQGLKYHQVMYFTVRPDDDSEDFTAPEYNLEKI